MATDKRKLLTEIPNVGVYPDQETFNKLEPQRQKRDKELITDAVAETKSSRDKALENAHNALVDAFGPKVDPVEPDNESITGEDLDEIIKELEGASDIIKKLENTHNDDDMLKECRKRLDEARDPSVPPSDREKMYRDIHRKFWAYVQSLPEKKDTPPRPLTETDHAVRKFMTGKWQGKIPYLSHEGSTILSAIIAVSDGGYVFLGDSQLPENDRLVLREAVQTHFGSVGFPASFRVTLDEYKNFEFSFDKDSRKITLGNRVASVPPNESSPGGLDVKVERRGKEILIGNQIKLERSRIQNLVNQPDPTNNGANRGGFSPRQKVAGRNAYEIRSDVLEMALDWAKNSDNKKLDTDDVLEIAEAFYSFVEHK